MFSYDGIHEKQKKNKEKKEMRYYYGAYTYTRVYIRIVAVSHFNATVGYCRYVIIILLLIKNFSKQVTK